MPAVDLKFHFLAASCAAPYDDEASTSIVPFLTCTHVYVRIVSLLSTRIIPYYPTWAGMSTGKIKKDSALPGAIRGQLFGLSYRANTTGSNNTAVGSGPGESLTPEPEPEQLIGLLSPATPTRPEPDQKARFVRPRK